MPGGRQAVCTNRFMGVFKTSYGTFINLTVLSPGPYIEDVFGHLGIPEAAKVERFSTAEAIMADAAEAYPLVKAAIAARPFDYLTQHLQTMQGQWAAYQ